LQPLIAGEPSRLLFSRVGPTRLLSHLAKLANYDREDETLAPLFSLAGRFAEGECPTLIEVEAVCQEKI
jgi:hypothetical protein